MDYVLNVSIFISEFLSIVSFCGFVLPRAVVATDLYRQPQIFVCVVRHDFSYIRFFFPKKLLSCHGLGYFVICYLRKHVYHKGFPSILHPNIKIQGKNLRNPEDFFLAAVDCEAILGSYYFGTSVSHWIFGMLRKLS